ncbi:MAG: hypothetical protein JNK05_36285 [Myxococcales bacterium]|nr:hypothetical protein [Myxococcales bacterium]
MLSHNAGGPCARRARAWTLAVALANAHCGQRAFGMEPEATIADPFPTADASLIAIAPDAATSVDPRRTDASPFGSFDGRVRENDTRLGILTVSTTLFLQRPFGGARASASFVRSEIDPRCPILIDGEYFFADCPTEQAPDGETLPRAHAGRIYAQGTGLFAILAPDSTGAYANVTLDSRALPAGLEVTFSAMGAEVPAFEGRVSIPRPIELTIDSPSDRVLRSTQEVAVRWTARAGGRISVMVSCEYLDDSANSRLVFVGATYDTAAGVSRIPPRVLRRLAANGTTSQCSLVTRIENRTELQAGPWPLWLRALHDEVDDFVRFER